MRDHKVFDKIDFHLIRILYTVLTQRSVSKVAMQLGAHQPAASGAPRRLRDFAGHPLLVRAGSLMVPSNAASRGRAKQGLRRRIAAPCHCCGLIPAMVASTLLVLTTGRQYGECVVANPLKRH